MQYLSGESRIIILVMISALAVLIVVFAGNRNGYFPEGEEVIFEI
jgi:hypothetical protein